MKQSAVYVCPSRRCRNRGIEFSGMLPAEVRRATGGYVTCPSCGTPASMRRVEISERADHAIDERGSER